LAQGISGSRSSLAPCAPAHGLVPSSSLMGHGALVPMSGKDKEASGTNDHVAPAVLKTQAAKASEVSAASASAATSGVELTLKPMAPKRVELTLPSMGPKAPSGDPAAASSSLASRRKLLVSGLNLKVEKKEIPLEQPEKGADGVVLRDGKSGKTIMFCRNFAELYKLGREVMPSTNTGMEVLFATRVSDGAEMVIKTRDKSKSFINKQEEQDWRRSTEMLLNLPESENIARLHECLEDKAYYYVIMEKVEGMDLFELLQIEKRMPIMEAKAILLQLLQAVNDLHSRGVIHKDLKLENVMVDTSPATSPKYSSRASYGHLASGEQSPTVVKLIDFDTVEAYSPKILAKSVVGTDQYISQEAYAGRYSPASDIFSVGVIAFKLISGKFPFKNAMFDDKPGENYVGSPKMKVIQDRLRHFHVDFTGAPWPSEPQARLLVSWMLQNNEKDRPTAEAALASSFFETTGMSPTLPPGPGPHGKNGRS